jgi:hypothetical protein
MSRCGRSPGAWPRPGRRCARRSRRTQGPAGTGPAADGRAVRLMGRPKPAKLAVPPPLGFDCGLGAPFSSHVDSPTGLCTEGPLRLCLSVCFALGVPAAVECFWPHVGDGHAVGLGSAAERFVDLDDA